MPEPAFLIGMNIPCAGGLGIIESLSRRFKKDLFVRTVPQGQDDESIRFHARQIKKMAAFVSEHTGTLLDYAALYQAMENTNKAREIMVEAYDLAKTRPSPVRSKTLANFGIVMALLLGTPESVEVARAFRDEFKKKVVKQEGGIPNERFRLLWIQNRIQFPTRLIDILESEYNAVIVADELNDITWDPINPDDPFYGLAARAISIPSNGPIERRIDHLQKMAKDFEVDGAINPCHWGCRQGIGARSLVAEGLKKIGIPVLNLDVDCVDSRNFAEGQAKTRIEAFMEMLEHRKSL